MISVVKSENLESTNFSFRWSKEKEMDTESPTEPQFSSGKWPIPPISTNAGWIDLTLPLSLGWRGHLTLVQSFGAFPFPGCSHCSRIKSEHVRRGSATTLKPGKALFILTLESEKTWVRIGRASIFNIRENLRLIQRRRVAGETSKNPGPDSIIWVPVSSWAWS